MDVKRGIKTAAITVFYLALPSGAFARAPEITEKLDPALGVTLFAPKKFKSMGASKGLLKAVLIAAGLMAGTVSAQTNVQMAHVTEVKSTAIGARLTQGVVSTHETNVNEFVNIIVYNDKIYSISNGNYFDEGDKLSVGSDYQVEKVTDDSLTLVVQKVVKTDWHGHHTIGLKKVKFSIIEVAETPSASR